MNNGFQIENQGVPVTELKGTCIVFLCVNLPDESTRLIELVGYHKTTEGFSFHGTQTTGWSGMSSEELSKSMSLVGLRRFSFTPYLQLTYRDSSGIQRLDRFTMIGFRGLGQPYDKLANSDAKVSLLKFDADPSNSQQAAKAIMTTIEVFKKAGQEKDN
jgi:hypothetical protein